MDKIKYIFLIVFLFGGTVSAFQDETSLVSEKAGMLEQYYDRNPQELLSIQLAKDIYLPRDTVWFSALVTNRISRELSTLSKVLHVEIWDPELEEPVVASRLKISNGLVDGQIVLPEDLAAKAYYLRAYTKLMLNVPDSYHLLPIYVNVRPSAPVQEATVELSYYPEGGQFVEDIANRISVVGPATAQYLVLDDRDREVASFSTDSSGIGAFILSPKRKSSYFIIDSVGNKTPLKDADPAGLGILLTQTATVVRMNIQSGPDYMKNTQSGNLHILVEAKGLVYFALPVVLSDKGYYVAELPKSRLPQGIARITVFDDGENVLLERIFNNGSTGAAPAHVGIAKANIERREKQTITVYNDTESLIQLSMAVSNLDVLHKDNLIQPNIAGLQNVPSRHINSRNLDLALTCASWPSIYSWENVVQNQSVNNSFSAERLLTYRGKALDPSGNVVKNQRLDILLLKSDAVYEATTDDSGKFDLFLFDFFDEEDILFSSPDEDLTSIKLIRYAPNPKFPMTEIVEEMDGDPRSYREKIEKLYNLYQTQFATIREWQLFPDIEYGIENLSVDLAEYVDFATMTEVFREIVSGVLVRAEKEAQTLRVFLPGSDEYAKGVPLFFVNGQPTKDISFILSLDPSEVRRISVLRTEDVIRKYRSISANGIILVETYDKELQPKRMGSYVPNVRGLSSVSKFQGPDYGKEQSHDRIPDLREVLYWRGPESIEAEGSTEFSFYGSDVIGAYQLHLSGKVENGEFFNITKPIRIQAER